MTDPMFPCVAARRRSLPRRRSPSRRRTLRRRALRRRVPLLRLPGVRAARPRRRTVRRVHPAQLISIPRTRPSAWTLYARWEWRRAVRRR
ncbi:hypothetical protein [Actinomadura algeriensis]|uniref:Uncharacterized protein n=1 Tax=Actinomadura algeriensis TaxID=1679523 RepID=A0ABR9JMH0_9ACTN|nr:hypothetical protein [Actinomadura algeriensis]MBE1531761.1 hypothetical protein [Actinomadura algeriensis]